MTVIVKRKTVVWEIQEFNATVPDDVNANDYVRANIGSLTEMAYDDNRLDYRTGKQSDEIEVEDQQGNNL